jgi:alpha-mannosidase
MMADRIRRVYFYHHTHTDIGYTHAQEEVVEQQAANISRALDFCALTEQRPPEARFAWTVETGWTLARFWERAGEKERARFARYAREGRVQITASYFHLTQLATPELLARSLAGTFEIAAACGVPIDTALSTDINGVNLFYLHLFAQLGVRYLNTAINTGRGGSPLPEERPGGFWWEGPTGERLLVWNNEMYQFGNERLGFPDSPSYGALQRYCAQLEERGYPFDTLIVPVQGYHIDNAMPNMALCDMIEEFNREAGYTRCRLVTLGEALRDVEVRYGDGMPVYRGAWPDWWDDGIGSSAFETGLVRFAHGDLLAAEKAAALATALGAPAPFERGELEQLAENLLHYDEHTWGWWRSVEDPFSVESRVLGQRKSLYAGEAAMEGRRYRERAVRALAGRVMPARPDLEQVIVFNPLAWPRRELVRHCAVWRNPAATTPGAVRVHDAEGRNVPVRCEIDHYSGCFIWFTDLWIEFEVEVPALGYAIYTIERTDRPVPPREETAGRMVENAFYRAEMDETGAVISLVDKELGRELCAKTPYRMNQLVYETVTSPGGRADALAPHYPPFDFMPRRAGVSLSTPTEAQILVRRDPFGVSLVSTASMAPFRSIVQEVRLSNAHKRVDFSTRLIKYEVDGTEAAYIAFPFALKPARVQCDISGGVFTPGAEQIRGTATDWYDLQHGVQLADDDLTLTWLCAEAPLVEFGEMKTGKTPSAPILDNGLLFSYVLNNHWFTNFFARQSGEIVARFRLLSERSSSATTLGRAGRELLTPLLPVRLGARSARGPGLETVAGIAPAATGTFARVLEGDAALDAVKQAREGRGWIIRLHETAGRRSTVRLWLCWPVPVLAVPCDLLERPLPGAATIDVEGEHVFVVDLPPSGTASWRLQPLSL